MKITLNFTKTRQDKATEGTLRLTTPIGETLTVETYGTKIQQTIAERLERSLVIPAGKKATIKKIIATAQTQKEATVVLTLYRDIFQPQDSGTPLTTITLPPRTTTQIDTEIELPTSNGATAIAAKYTVNTEDEESEINCTVEIELT